MIMRDNPLDLVPVEGGKEGEGIRGGGVGGSIKTPAVHKP